MEKRKIFKMVLMPLIMIALFAVLVYLFMLLWNGLMPSITGWSAINYWQSLGLMVLGRLFACGFGIFRGGGIRHRHKAELHSRLSNMTKEEKLNYIKEHFQTKINGGEHSAHRQNI